MSFTGLLLHPRATCEHVVLTSDHDVRRVLREPNVGTNNYVMVLPCRDEARDQALSVYADEEGAIVPLAPNVAWRHFLALLNYVVPPGALYGTLLLTSGVDPQSGSHKGRALPDDVCDLAERYATLLAADREADARELVHHYARTGDLLDT